MHTTRPFGSAVDRGWIGHTPGYVGAKHPHLKAEQSMPFLITAETARTVLAKPDGQSVIRVSLDLGLSEAIVKIRDGLIIFPTDETVSIPRLEKVVKDDSSVYMIEHNNVVKVELFSEQTSRYYKLHATSTWPALVISGITMHRIKETDPKRDMENKIRLLSPIRGRVLDTCCGLGYTAIGAARTADLVITVEKDENVLQLAGLNPYSRELFENDRIEIRDGDVTEVVKQFPEGSFDLIIHDPPTISIAGELYSDDFYFQLFRVLRNRGRLFHYTGSPGSRYRKVDLPRSVARRLKAIGFVRTRRDELTLGVLAKKP